MHLENELFDEGFYALVVAENDCRIAISDMLNSFEPPRVINSDFNIIILVAEFDNKVT